MAMAAVLLLPRTIRRNYASLNLLKLIPFRIFFVPPSQLLSFSAKHALIFLSFKCFMFFNLNLLSSSIKTEKVTLKVVSMIG